MESAKGKKRGNRDECEEQHADHDCYPPIWRVRDDKRGPSSQAKCIVGNRVVFRSATPRVDHSLALASCHGNYWDKDGEGYHTKYQNTCENKGSCQSKKDRGNMDLAVFLDGDGEGERWNLRESSGQVRLDSRVKQPFCYERGRIECMSMVPTQYPIPSRDHGSQRIASRTFNALA